MRFHEATWSLPDRDDASVVRESQFPIRLKLLRWFGRQTWIPRGQDRILRRIWNPDSGRNYCFEVDFFGRRYPGDLAHLIDWTVFVYGSYCYHELSLLEALSNEIRKRKGEVFFLMWELTWGTTHCSWRTRRTGSWPSNPSLGCGS